jgi:hypothetical protein
VPDKTVFTSQGSAACVLLVFLTVALLVVSGNHFVHCHNPRHRHSRREATKASQVATDAPFKGLHATLAFEHEPLGTQYR